MNTHPGEYIFIAIYICPVVCIVVRHVFFSISLSMCLLSSAIGTEPGKSSQSAEGGDKTSDRSAGDTKAAGRRRPRGSETSRTGPKAAS